MRQEGLWVVVVELLLLESWSGIATRVKRCHLLARVAHLLGHEKAVSGEALRPSTRNQISQVASLHVFLLTRCGRGENDFGLQGHLLRIEVLISDLNICVALFVFKMADTLRLVLKGEQERVVEDVVSLRVLDERCLEGAGFWSSHLLGWPIAPPSLSSRHPRLGALR